jgi:hypothetical protein
VSGTPATAIVDGICSLLVGDEEVCFGGRWKQDIFAILGEALDAAPTPDQWREILRAIAAAQLALTARPSFARAREQLDQLVAEMSQAWREYSGAAADTERRSAKRMGIERSMRKDARPANGTRADPLARFKLNAPDD